MINTLKNKMAQISVIRMAVWLGKIERWYLVLGGVVVGRGIEPQCDLELSFAELLIEIT
jgi:hypothetical protein